MNVRVKSDYRWHVIRAFGGREYIKNEFRPVPAGMEADALTHPAMEIELVAAERIVPVVKPKAEAHAQKGK